jgi:outer membrane protein
MILGAVLLAVLSDVAPAAAPTPPAPVATPTPAPSGRVITLAEAIATARDKQPQIHQASAVTRAGVARADEALSALLPQVSGSGTYERTTANFALRPGALPSGVGTTANAESWQTFNYFSLGVTASQLIYDFGQTSNRWRSARASAASLRDTEKTVMTVVLFGVRNSFFQARAAKELVVVATETLSNQKKHLTQTEGFVEVGTQAEIALAQTRTDVANAKVLLISAENGYDTARAQLNQAMGVEGTIDYDVSNEHQPAIEGEDATTDVLLGEAVKNRPELAALMNQVAAQDLTVSSLQSSYAPSLGLSANYSKTGVEFSNLTWNAAALLNLSVPIFLGGLTPAQIREARANVDASRAQLDLERQQVRLEVEQARLAVRAAKSVVEASGEALVNAKDLLNLAEGRYETGVGSIIELGDAQIALTTAGPQSVQAEYGLAQARAQLVKALGRD